MNFIWKIFHGKIDEAVHRQFIRFGKGEYKRRAILSFWRTSSIKVKSSFEFANDFVLFVTGLGNINFNGVILSKNELEGMPDKGIKKEGKWVYNVNNFSSDKVKSLSPRVYCFLLNADSGEIKLRLKGKLPKPGKSELKVDEKFCQIELDERYYKAIKDDFFWDIPDCKKANIEHAFIVEEIIMPRGETDYSKIRETAKRKGKLIRIVNVDGREIRKESDFEA